MLRRWRALWSVGVGTAILTAACMGATHTESPRLQAPVGGDAVAGREAIRAHGCQTCHVVPGVPGNHGRVGPSLEGFALRVYIAGVLPNTHENLERWVMDPRSINPATAMPVLGLSNEDARNIAAYLATLD